MLRIVCPMRLVLLVAAMLFSGELFANPIGEIKMNDGRMFHIAALLPDEVNAHYFVRSDRRFVPLENVRALMRIDAGLSGSRYYQLTMIDGDWRDFSSSVFLFRRVDYKRAEGEWAQAYAPVLKDRDSNGFRFMAVNPGADGYRYVEITNPADIREIRFYGEVEPKSKLVKSAEDGTL